MTEYPFHTAEIDGEEVVGVMFVAGSGRFYEFQNPEDHDDYERHEDPRTGNVLTHDGPVDAALRSVMGARVKALVPADEWASFREDYVSADEEKVDEWESEWERIHRSSLEEYQKNEAR